MSQETITIEATLLHETPRAYRINDGKREAWLPKAEVEYDPDEETFTMPEWLAMDRGLI